MCRFMSPYIQKRSSHSVVSGEKQTDMEVWALRCYDAQALKAPRGVGLTTADQETDHYNSLNLNLTSALSHCRLGWPSFIKHKCPSKNCLPHV
ncbi:hypothetical protein PoB_004015900 [Plakobranchus ocellatus]|uniref:Uncharacterized protein n=1 Tax=Plakobranchus ocellatus TaxID=259542 RepID=A0AAV4B0W2_9GAST|nr:hypothetical protein PoB_004015900 [Plakobranchus ocellatus]